MSSNKQQKPIQKTILRALSNKKATSLTEIIEKVVSSSPKIITTPLPCRQAGSPLLDKEGRKKVYAINRSVNNLLIDGLIESFKTEHNKYFRLTREGRQKLNNIALEAESSLVSTKWDSFWRIILLDLPEERKNEREALRYLLKKAGFICVKNSVWVSMFPFEHLFNNIKKDLGLSTELIILVTDKLDEETEKEFFVLCGIK